MLNRFPRIAILRLPLNEFTQLDRGPLLLPWNLRAIPREYLASAVEDFLIALHLRHDPLLFLQWRKRNFEFLNLLIIQSLSRSTGLNCLNLALTSPANEA